MTMLLPSLIPETLKAAYTFTGTFGINYGRIADNIPSPEKVVQLLRAAKIRNVRIYDFDHSVLQAFSGTELELVVGLPNGYVQDMSENPDHALSWVQDNDPKHINISYALFQRNPGIIDSQTKLHYDNLLDAQIDAAYAALEDGGFDKMEIIVTETGWASRGDPNEEVATPENARNYNFNLLKRLALRKGTPMRPKIMLKAYFFAIFNEDDKPGPTSERNFGFWKPDGSISYDVGFPALKSSAVATFSLKVQNGYILSTSIFILQIFFA